MPRFLIYEDIRETRKYIIEAENLEGVITAWEQAIENGDQGSFVDASTINYEVQRLDDADNTVETYPAVQVE
jgi:hypothetical protein